jgi:hypothetical protein
MDSQNETLNFVNLLEDTYNEYMMETPNISDHNSNPHIHGTQMCPPSRELPEMSFNFAPINILGVWQRLNHCIKVV